ncbi:cystatin-F isoform X3 [Emydura macquarii macquarii]
MQKPNSTTRPGFPMPMDTNDPGVRRAARFGVYRYNNSSNDLFLFKESHINKAMVQIVRGLKYMLNVEIGRTVCDKRGHSSLDSCDFQKKKKLKQPSWRAIHGTQTSAAIGERIAACLTYKQGFCTPSRILTTCSAERLMTIL